MKLGIERVFGQEATEALLHSRQLLRDAGEELKGIFPSRRSVALNTAAVTLTSSAVGAAVCHATGPASAHFALQHLSEVAQHVPVVARHLNEIADHANILPGLASAMSTAALLVTGQAKRLYERFTGTAASRLNNALIGAAVKKASVTEELLSSTSFVTRAMGRFARKLENAHGVQEAEGVINDVIASVERVRNTPPGDEAIEAMKGHAKEAHGALKTGLRGLNAPMLTSGAETLPIPVHNYPLRASIGVLKDGITRFTGDVTEELGKVMPHILTAGPVTGRPSIDLDGAVARQLPLGHLMRSVTSDRLGPDALAHVESLLAPLESQAVIASRMADQALSHGAEAARLARTQIVDPHIVGASAALEEIMREPQLQR